LPLALFFSGAQIAATPVGGAFLQASQAERDIRLIGGIERLLGWRPRHLLVRGGLNWCGPMF
jgi:hypothetical protein